MMRQGFKRALTAALAALLATAGAAAIASPAPAGARPARPTIAQLEAYEREMRANGTEARVMAESDAKGRPKGDGPVKGFPRVPGKSAGAGGSAMLTPCTAPCYHYNGFVQDLTSDPATAAAMATMTGKPYVDNGTYAATHSLGELAVQSANLGYNLGGTAISPSWTILSGSPGTTGVWGTSSSSGTTGETGGPGFTGPGGSPGNTGSC